MRALPFLALLAAAPAWAGLTLDPGRREPAHESWENIVDDIPYRHEREDPYYGGRLIYAKLPSKLASVTISNFDAEVKQSREPVFLFYYTQSCGVCETVRFIFEEWAEEHQGKIKFAKVNLSEEAPMKREDIVPAFYQFKDGKFRRVQLHVADPTFNRDYVYSLRFVGP